MIGLTVFFRRRRQIMSMPPSHHQASCGTAVGVYLAYSSLTLLICGPEVGAEDGVSRLGPFAGSGVEMGENMELCGIRSQEHGLVYPGFAICVFDGGRRIAPRYFFVEEWVGGELDMT